MSEFKENIKVCISNLPQPVKEELAKSLPLKFSLCCESYYILKANYIYIYIDDNKVSWGSSQEHFNRHTSKEVSAEELISMLKGGFTKSDLKVGVHIIERTEGDRYLLLGVDDWGVCGINLDGLTHHSRILYNLREDLTSDCGRFGDVVKVYTLSNSTIFKDLEKNLNLVWERETKSKAQIQYEECEKKMQELQEEMGKLKQQM